ncbi:MAG: NAD(P)/FAD-dependent oxidoreductase, partial [Chloroflexota bacterium]
MSQYDVLIIGGGPAGAACAWRLRQGNVNCLVLDKAAFPRQKPCAGWIPPKVLTDLDFEPSEYPYGFTTFPALHISIRGFPFILPGKQHAIRRFEFDAWLLARSGATFEEHHVKNIKRTGDSYIIDGEYSGKFLVGAGGTHCPVYHTQFKAAGPRDESSRIVAQEDEFPYPWKDKRCRLWFLENGLPGYAWYVPKANGYVNVGVGGNSGSMKARGENIKNHWRYLVEKLEKLGLVKGHDFQPVAHVYHLHRKLPEVRRENVFLVGDAAGLATLDMGEGIGPAVRSGLLAAEAILGGGDYSLDELSKYSLLP